MPVTLRKLPRLPELTKLQALLLAGGAFVFASAFWAACRFDVFIDRTPSAPAGTVFAATVDRRSPHWPELEAALPEKARQASRVAEGLDSMTLFAVPGADGLEWWTVEALSAATERTGRKRLRLVEDGTAAAGFVVLNGRETPFTARFGDGRFEARVGRDFLGPDFRPNPFAAGRRLTSPMPGQTAYLEKPLGADWGPVSALLGASLQHFKGLSGLWSLPGRLELAVSATTTDGVSPFILYYRPSPGSSLPEAELEAAGRALLAETDPVGVTVLMPDATAMTEYRHEPTAVGVERKDVRSFGKRATLRMAGSRQKLELFYANDGEAWFSDDLGRIQAAIMSGVSAVEAETRCGTDAHEGRFVFRGGSIGNFPYFQSLNELIFSMPDDESGLFTICGYLVH